MLENVKSFVSEKMDKVEDFCRDHYCSILVASVLASCGAMVAIAGKYYNK